MIELTEKLVEALAAGLARTDVIYRIDVKVIPVANPDQIPLPLDIPLVGDEEPTKLGVRDVAKMVGKVEPWVYAEAGANRFPKPVNPQAKRKLWLVSEVEAWMAGRP